LIRSSIAARLALFWPLSIIGNRASGDRAEPPHLRSETPIERTCSARHRDALNEKLQAERLQIIDRFETTLRRHQLGDLRTMVIGQIGRPRCCPGMLTLVELSVVVARG
jgi:hypothetical protein